MFTKIVNSKRGKFTALLLACVVLFSSFTMPAGNVVVLKAGTMVNLELVNEVTSKMAAGLGNTHYKFSLFLADNQSFASRRLRRLTQNTHR